MQRAIEVRLEILRNEASHASSGDNVKKNSNQQVLRIAENPYENLSFPENMSYDKRSMLRKECQRYVRFSYLVDCLALDSLT